jgi:alpha-glucosidase
MSSPIPHHDGSPLHVSTQTPSLGEVVRVRLRVPEGFRPLASVKVRSNPDHEPAWSTATRLGPHDGWEWWEAPVTVTDPRFGYRWLLVPEDGKPLWLNQSGLHGIETLDAEDFWLLAHPAPPAWMTDAVMYQIFPDRFARSAAADDRQSPDWAIPAQWDDPVDPEMPGRSQQFYGGDLDGVVEKLPHLVDLGVNLLYLTPFFPAASNHRYDAASFDRVDPLLGGDDALVRLVEAAHELGIRVIGDLTSNHSGDRHEWFRAAHGHPGAPEEDFYYFLDEGNTRYESWLGTPTLPKFDWSSQQLRDRFIEGRGSVVAKWLLPPYGLDGWRIDVANMTGRLGEVDLNAEVRQTLRRTMIDVDPDTILLAEITNDAASDLTGDGWHGAMTYASFTRPLWAWLTDRDRAPGAPWFFGQPVGGIPPYTARDFVDSVTRFTASIPWRVRLGNMQPLDTHDTARFATRAAAGAVPLALGLSLTLPGLPTLFAGDEFGLLGDDGETSRTPMPWGTQDAAATERLELYRALIALRRAHAVLGDGGLRWVHVDDETIVFVREGEEESLLVLAATDDVEVTVPAVAVPGAAAAATLFGDAALTEEADGVTLRSTGPVFAVWALPGVTAPSRGR